MPDIVSCRRVDDLADPLPGSTREHCFACGVPVWFRVWDLPAGTNFVLVCMDCRPRTSSGLTIMFAPGQVDTLRTVMSDENIARMLAIARLTDGDPTRVRSFIAEVRSDPGLQRRYDEATVTAASDLAAVMRQPR